MPRRNRPADKVTPADLDKPQTPAAEWQVRKLVRLGVPEGTARDYSMRQAFAVIASMTKARERVRKAKGE